VVRPHEATEVGRIRKTLHQQLLAGDLERLQPRVEEPAHVVLAPPEQRRQRIGGQRRRVAVDDLEHVARQADGNERRDPDRSTRLANPHELIGHRLMMWGEDRARR
jgi:hypothetical protein